MLALLPFSPALAQDGDVDGTFDPDAKPEAPRPDLPDIEDDTRVYAGVGSGVAYASRGTGEFGGSMSFSASPGVSTFSADPMAGYFVLDNVQLSAVLGFRRVALDGEATNRFSLLAEPSVHLPFNDGLFWVGGLGMGGALTDGLREDGGITGGFALAPRTGLQLLVGRSGILNLGARYSMVFSDIDADVNPATGQAVLAFVNTFDVQAGYTVMF